jgi:hypothetical protein
MEPDAGKTTQQAKAKAHEPEPIVDPFWAIGVGLIVLFAVGAAALAN